MLSPIIRDISFGVSSYVVVSDMITNLDKYIEVLEGRDFLVIRYEGKKSRSSLGFVELFKGLELGKDYTLKELGL